MNSKRLLIVVAVLAAAIFVGGLTWSDWSSEAGERVKVVMYQNPACGCCSKWAQHMERNGFEVEIHKSPELNRIKEREGITRKTAACHTSFVGGYVVEGHVPARDIKRLLREKPQVHGLTVPGMPAGSPGMEGPRRDRYDVLTFDKEGNTTVYSSY